MVKRKMTKRQTMIYIYKAQHIILKIEQGEHHKIPRVSSGISERLTVPAALVTPAVLLLNDSIYKMASSLHKIVKSCLLGVESQSVINITNSFSNDKETD